MAHIISCAGTSLMVKNVLGKVKAGKAMFIKGLKLHSETWKRLENAHIFYFTKFD